MKNTLARILVLGSLLISALPACQANTPPVNPAHTPAPVQPVTPTLAPTASANHLKEYLSQSLDLAPRLVSSNPASGEEVGANADLSFSFNQAMDPGATSQALSIVPQCNPCGAADASPKPVEGSLSWKDARTLVFHPQKPLQTGAGYLAKLDISAKSALGKPLEQPVELSFQTAGELKVSQVFPADGAVDVENSATVTVMFNRPVVHLVVAEEQAGLTNPLQLDPPVKGHGEWINTSLYVFHPDEILKGGQTYQASVKAGLQDASGSADTTLKADTTWSFRVASPSLAGATINDEDLGVWQQVPLNPTLRIMFNQPMDPKSVEANLRITAAGNPIPVIAKWDEKSTQVDIRPALQLQLDTAYNVNLDAAAQDTNGASLAAGLQNNFSTVPAPAINGMMPNDGAIKVDPSFKIYFASPMDFKSLADKVVFTPALDTKTHSWYEPVNNTLTFYGLEPSTLYTVKILGGMRDPYGNSINGEREVTFTTQALTPSAMLVMPYNPIYRTGGPQDFFLRYVNVNSVSASLYHLTQDQAAKVLNNTGKESAYSGDEQDVVWHVDLKPDDKQDEQVTKNISLTGKDGGALAPGFYFLGLKASPVEYTGPFLDSRLLFVSSDNVSIKVSPGQILAWVTDLTTGKPTAGLPVKFFDRHFLQSGEGVTDANGLVQAALDTTPDHNAFDKGSYESLSYVMIDAPGHFAFACSQWGSGASPDAFGLFNQYYRPWFDTTSYVYTERPLYRPGQPVYFKGIVRSDDDLAYSLPTQKEVEVDISNYQQQVYKQTFPLSEIGTFDGKFNLDPETTLGSYSLQILWPGSDTLLGSVNFDVAEYRRPEFQIETKASPSNVLPGDSFDVDLAASYYSGGGLSNASVAWTLNSDPYTFTPPADFSSYSFSNDEADNWEYYRTRQGVNSSEQVAQGQGQTGADGIASFALKAQPVSTNDSRKLTFEATVTDFTGASVSSQAQVVMHKSAVYPGVRSKSYVGTVGDAQTFELVALDWDGKAQANAKVDVQIVERNWYSVQQEDDNGQLTWQTTVQETPAASFDGVQLDGKGLGQVQFRPAKGGVYRAKVTARDAHGNQAQASTFIWVAGSDFVPWAQTNDRTFQLVVDRSSYTPGQTAELLIASPFQGENYALVTVERGHVRKEEVLKLEGNSTLYRLPVTADMAPNVYVSVLVIKGVDATNPRPSFKIGMAKLNVATDEQSLKVTLSADHDLAAPRDPVQYTVQTATLDGKPAAAEVSLALSDLATLSLRDAYAPPLMDFFYSPRSLSVTTAVAILENIEEYNAQISDHQTANGAGAGSGGGKGGGYMGITEVRQDFPDTAFWQAQVQTGADGKATVQVTLPDNLTTWRMDARAVTADTHVGQATLDLTSTKPLLIRPQTPRFAVVGDHLVLGAAVHNNTDQELSVTVTLEATGMTLKGPAGQSVQIPAKQQSYVTWEGDVPAGSTRLDLVFRAQGGGYVDATKPTLGTLDNQGIPVYRYESPETVGTSGVVTDNGARLEAIDLPDSLQVQKGQLNVELAPSLAAGMTDGLTYLKDYPYDCTEQTISRFLPNLSLEAALKAAGSSDAALEENLKTQVNLALQKLYNRQNPDGGWGWWGGMDSDVLTTAYATLGLVEAKTAGYPVNDPPFNSLGKAIEFLRTNLKSLNDLAAASELNRQSFVLYVLARAGLPQVSETVQLYDQRQAMAFYARAYLLQTLHMINPQDARLKTLLSDLGSAAILSATGAHWEEKSPDYQNWNTDLRSTAIVLAAVIETDPNNALAANAVRWLMVNRKDGRWDSTQETAWTLLALTDWVTATGELKPDYRYAVAFNGNELAEGTASPQTLRDVKNLTIDVTQLLANEANQLVFARDGSAGSLYYTAHLNLWLPTDQVQALDRGVVISRQYFRPEDLTAEALSKGAAQPVTQARQGDVLLARLTVVAPNILRYLVVDDPLPAGMEAVDTSLNSSPKAQTPDDYDWKRVGTEGWGWWFFTHSEMRDEKVVLSTDILPAGTYVYTYLVRASSPGTFNVMPPTAQEFYFPEDYGRGDGSQFVIAP